MPRRQGLLGAARRRLLEAASAVAPEPPAVEPVAAEPATGGRLVESVDTSAWRTIARRLGRVALNAIDRGPIAGQDDEPQTRIEGAQRVRETARKDSQMLYAVRLRNAFCFGDGVPAPRAADPDVQDVLDDLWNAEPNKAELTTPEAQWRCGKDTWENGNLYLVVYAGLSEIERSQGEAGSGLDGRVLLGGLQHDLVRTVVRDPANWGRVVYYVVTEYVYEWDYARDAPKANPAKRTAYYEALDGMRALREEIDQGRTENLPPLPPPGKLRAGQVLHLAPNRGKESAFGEPELRTTIRHAIAVQDLVAGQAEKARAAQRYLMKFTAKGARTQNELTDLAMTAVAPGSPLANADAVPDPDNPMRVADGALIGNGALDAQPFPLDTGASGARADIETAAALFATGTNFGPHFFIAQPGSLAGSQTLELPTLKLTDVDKSLFEQAAFRKLCDLRIERARTVGLLPDMRPITEEEAAQGMTADAAGMVERDFTYSVNMPETTKRNVPELMGLVADGAAVFDPTTANRPMKRALLGYYLDLLDLSDGPAVLEAIMAADDQLKQQQDQEAEDAAEAQRQALAGAGGGEDTFTGPDGKQHSSQNPYGARVQSAAVVEAADVDVDGLLRALARRAVELGHVPVGSTEG